MVDQSKSKLLTFIFSIAPGLGHFYLGFMNRGLQFMVAFFGGIALMDFLSLGGLALFLPVIWFYALFDALQMASSIQSGETLEDIPLVPWEKLKIGNTWIGWGLIILGGYLIIKQILPPLLPWVYTARYIQTGFVAILLILGGIRILMPRKEKGE